MKNNKGCGELTNVIGTNGGKMKCGAKLTQLDGSVTAYYCNKCKAKHIVENTVKSKFKGMDIDVI